VASLGRAPLPFHALKGHAPEQGCPAQTYRAGLEDRLMHKILLVDDDENNRDMLMRRMQRRGFEVIVAVDGDDACAKARQDVPDLILMDLHLPVLDGWQASRRLKGEEATRHVPIIALTADAMSGDQEKALEAGCDDYDTKPVDLPRLLDKIHRLLSIARENRAQQ
jgi:CheY-like chemotaxis protein